MRKRNIFIIAAIVILIPVVAFAWWLLSPLFLSTTVDEEFPYAANAVVPADMTMAEVEVVMETMAEMEPPEVDEPMPFSVGQEEARKVGLDAANTTVESDLAGSVKETLGEVVVEKESVVEIEKLVEVEKEVPVVVEAVREVIIEEVTEPTPPPSEPVALASGSFRDADSFHRGSGDATIYRLPDGSHLLRLEDFEVTNGPDLRVLLARPNDPQSRDELHAAGYTHLAKLKGNIGNQNYEIPADIDPSGIGSIIIYCMPFQVIFSVAPLSEPSG